jgi:hypothetical protein
MSEKRYPANQRRVTLAPTEHGYDVGRDLAVVVLPTSLAISSPTGYVLVSPDEAQALITAIADVAGQVAANRARGGWPR